MGKEVCSGDMNHAAWSFSPSPSKLKKYQEIRCYSKLKLHHRLATYWFRCHYSLLEDILETPKKKIMVLLKCTHLVSCFVHRSNMNVTPCHILLCWSSFPLMLIVGTNLVCRLLTSLSFLTNRKREVMLLWLVSSVAYLSLEYMLDHDKRNSLQTTERGNSHQFKELR